MFTLMTGRHMCVSTVFVGVGPGLRSQPEATQKPSVTAVTVTGLRTEDRAEQTLVLCVCCVCVMEQEEFWVVKFSKFTAHFSLPL